MSADEGGTPDPAAPTFAGLGLPAALVQALKDVGYESPTPIQAQTIPPLLAGRDLVGQAQTGTGKTAAFALPILARIDVRKRATQALVLAPTRELAIQVAEAFQRYAAHLPGFHVLPIYGGQSYTPQLASLKRGAHVVVGTPGRVIDHMDRGTLKLDALICLVLDEADEMLRMGFIEDVEKVLKKTPPTRQVVLFSATMPTPIRRIAQTHLKAPAEITIRGKTSTVANTRQRYWVASGASKLDALTRILEAETFDGMLVFVRTRQATAELAEKLEARGFAVAPLSGDIDQKQRERTVERLKRGTIDIIVATDVAARGLDVERVSHVVNYDVPNDTEAYVHRIGRTGRAGRSGEAILFIAPREKGMLRTIERATRQTITPMQLPSAADVQEQRAARFKERIAQTLASPEYAARAGPLRGLIAEYERETGVPPAEIAAALAHLAQGEAPPVAAMAPAPPPERAAETPAARPLRRQGEKAGHSRAGGNPGFGATTLDARVRGHDEEKRPSRPRVERIEPVPERPRRPKKEEHPMETYRVEVGHKHGVKPGNIVGAIANEAELDSQFIGRIEIMDDHSLVELPEGMPKEIFRDLKRVWVSGQRLQISKVPKK